MGAVLVLLAALSVLVATRRPGAAIHFLLMVLIPTLGADAIKLLVHRARPDIPSLPHILLLEPGELSYPSGHTSLAACFLVGIVIVTAGHRRHPFVMGAAAIVVLATAASRVHMGVHYPSDVAVSIVYSIAAVAYFVFHLNAVLAFWIADILTRPLGASTGDLLSQPVTDGGWGWGQREPACSFWP
ncbi:phosphatase PAP2 family protein [Cryobacterium sp. Hb1]|uniref:phosphatase PAP2 family protein n=1 Tax=Cryobacterium sp. Hb1 TaxID=1259147 RepID=UPI0018E0BEE8|nr:phosphatase PAP2 family protein [Cryobacterium sp. Hb1]